MASSAIAPQSLVGQFCDMRTSHYDRNARSTHGIRHLVGFPDHASHSSDSDQTDVLLPDILNQFCLVQAIGVPVHEKDFVTFGRKGLKQEHPEVGHEVVGDFIIGIVEQNIHANSAVTTWKRR